MRREVRRKLKRIAVSVGLLILTPAVIAGGFCMMPEITVAANRLAALTIGEKPDSHPEDTLLYLSDGYGWQAEQADAPPEPDDPPAQAAVASAQPAAPTGDTGPKPYPVSWNPGSGRVVRTQYKAYTGGNILNLERSGQVRNTTSVSNDVLAAESRKQPEFRIAADGSPQVLIMHTHTTESFEPCVRPNYDDSFNYRTTDDSKNVVAVGETIAAQLRACGIGVIHDATIHDYPSYNGSYGRSAVTVRRILQENPSIRVVLDVHRDAIASNGDILQPILSVNGREAAQVMIISGCDNGTLNMPHYLQNFRLASLFQQTLETHTPGLTRPVLFDYRKYNQDLTTGSLLLEIGSHGNTLEQAVYAGELVGQSLAEALLTLV